ncbi:hypothetical protein QYH69_18780 [Paraburkholderia sp. SARCC-3016]|uniref:hypothetical protein n=1 Tax=Paraburkholderia sp. SARCC-3016 TaxID=3058611 RepID=UPI002809CA55|nr:hypothetical protein [Paraburkholderia sp. SARCC-3016]MDQ7979297.1 hypothetical protein [Paraburkholderia sp. SARCC-3016]
MSHFDVSVNSFNDAPLTYATKLPRIHQRGLNGVTEVSGAYPQFWQARDIYSVLREAPAFLWYAVRPFP